MQIIRMDYWMNSQHIRILCFSVAVLMTYDVIFTPSLPYSFLFFPADLIQYYITIFSLSFHKFASQDLIDATVVDILNIDRSVRPLNSRTRVTFYTADEKRVHLE